PYAFIVPRTAISSRDLRERASWKGVGFLIGGVSRFGTLRIVHPQPWSDRLAGGREKGGRADPSGAGEGVAGPPPRGSGRGYPLGGRGRDVAGGHQRQHRKHLRCGPSEHAHADGGGAEVA